MSRVSNRRRRRAGRRTRRRLKPILRRRRSRRNSRGGRRSRRHVRFSQAGGGNLMLPENLKPLAYAHADANIRQNPDATSQAANIARHAAH